MIANMEKPASHELLEAGFFDVFSSSKRGPAWRYFNPTGRKQAYPVILSRVIINSTYFGVTSYNHLTPSESHFFSAIKKGGGLFLWLCGLKSR